MTEWDQFSPLDRTVHVSWPAQLGLSSNKSPLLNQQNPPRQLILETFKTATCYNFSGAWSNVRYSNGAITVTVMGHLMDAPTGSLETSRQTTTMFLFLFFFGKTRDHQTGQITADAFILR